MSQMLCPEKLDNPIRCPKPQKTIPMISTQAFKPQKNKTIPLLHTPTQRGSMHTPFYGKYAPHAMTEDGLPGATSVMVVNMNPLTKGSQDDP